MLHKLSIEYILIESFKLEVLHTCLCTLKAQGRSANTPWIKMFGFSLHQAIHRKRGTSWTLVTLA